MAISLFKKKSEISKILGKKEKIIFKGKPKYLPYMIFSLSLIMIISFFVGVLIIFSLKSFSLGILVAFTIFIFGFLIYQLRYERTHYVLTEKRAIIETGIIGRDFKSINYNQIKNISVNVGLLGVIFKVGTIKIFTGEIESLGGKNLRIQPKYDKFLFIKEPYKFLAKFQTFLSSGKRKSKM